MAEEIKNDELDMDNDYISQIEELKRNSIPRDQFDKLKGENKKLLEALVNNQQLEGTTIVEKPKIEDLRAKLFNSHNTNLEYIETALTLRDRLLEEGYDDPFVPQGRKISATREDEALAEKVAEGLRSCVEYANGNSELFTQELQRITKDTMIPTGNKRRR